MKKMMFIMLLMTLIGANAVFASGDEDVTTVAKKTFEKEFPSALYVKWEKVKNSDVYMVRFVYNDQALLSYINERGEMVATARNINKAQLPFMINEILRKKLSGYKVIQIEEVATASETSYFATLEDVKSITYVRLFSNGTFAIIKKDRK